jgi:hypothetical protein
LYQTVFFLVYKVTNGKVAELGFNCIVGSVIVSLDDQRLRREKCLNDERKKREEKQ